MKLSFLFAAVVIPFSLSIPFIHAQTLVSVDNVKLSRIAQSLTINGNVVAAREVDLANEEAGKVERVFVELGDYVEQGQLLLQLRDEDTRWQLRQAQAQLKSDKAQVTLAKLEEQRSAQLLRRDAVSKGVADEALAELTRSQAITAVREAEIARLQDRLQRHQIKAPFAGLISQRIAEQGGWLAQGATAFRLSTHNKLRVELLIPERYYGQLSARQTSLAISLRQLETGAQQAAKLERIIPIANQQRSFMLWLSVDNTNQQWIPGMSAVAEVSWREDSAQLTVQEDALVRKADGSIIVWKAISKEQVSDTYEAVAVTVTVGHSKAGRVEVHSDKLNVGDQVVVRGNELLKPQQAIRLSSSTVKQER